MKLAALYTVWNGLEFLDKSIEQIYYQVDFIVIAWQFKSNKGEENNQIIPFLTRFENNNKIHLIEFTPDFNINTKQNEINKLQIRIDFAKKLGATHFFSSATDHFYKPAEFEIAKNYCKTHDFDVTFTAMFTYYKHTTWQLYPVEDYFMPFICKLHPNTRVENVSGYPLRVDPSIRLNTCKTWYLFRPDEIMLHHYSMIRVDIENKFRNAAASIRWNPEQVNRFISEYNSAKLGDHISYFNGRMLIKVQDYFGFNTKST